MATVTPGYSFGATETVTNTKLAALASGTVTNIVQADATDTMIVVGVSPPSAATGRAWFDTSQGAGEGILKIYDNGRWTAVSQGFLGYNNGTSLSRGHIVQYDSSLTPASVGTIPVSKTAAPSAGVVQLARPRGVAAESIANGAYGVIITTGYCTVLKETGTVTAGDLIVPSSTVGASSNGRGESGNVGSWGATGGHAGIGRWLDTSAAVADTEVSAFIFPPSGSWTAFKNNGGTVVNNATNPTFNAWTNAGSLSTNVPGTIAHVFQFFVTYNQAATVGVIFGLRMLNSTVDVGTGAAHMRGSVTGAAGLANYNAYGGTLIVPETTGAAANTLQYYINSSDATSARWAMTINEVGVVIGGSIV